MNQISEKFIFVGRYRGDEDRLLSPLSINADWSESEVERRSVVTTTLHSKHAQCDLIQFDDSDTLV